MRWKHLCCWQISDGIFQFAGHSVLYTYKYLSIRIFLVHLFFFRQLLAAACTTSESVPDTPIHLLSSKNFSMALFSYFLLPIFTTSTYREHFNFTSSVLVGSLTYDCSGLFLRWCWAKNEKKKTNVKRTWCENIHESPYSKQRVIRSALATLVVRTAHGTRWIYLTMHCDCYPIWSANGDCSSESCTDMLFAVSCA